MRRNFATVAIAIIGAVWGEQVLAQTPSSLAPPSLIRSTFGDEGNFEVVIQDGGQLCHFYRDNDAPAAAGPFWRPSECFAEGVLSGPALIQSNYGDVGNFEVVFRNTASQLCHWTRDNDNVAAGVSTSWRLTTCFGQNIASEPALIQSSFGKQGNFDVVVRNTAGQLCHYFRDNDNAEEGFPWHPDPAAGEPEDCFSAMGFTSNDRFILTPAFIQSSFGDKGDLEVLAWETNGTARNLCHYSRQNDLTGAGWVLEECVFNSPLSPSTDIIIIPSLIQNTFSVSGTSTGPTRGNLEVIRVLDPITLARDTYDRKTRTWTAETQTARFGSAATATLTSGLTSAPAAIESDAGVFDHFEVVAWEFSQTTPPCVPGGPRGIQTDTSLRDLVTGELIFDRPGTCVPAPSPL